MTAPQSVGTAIMPRRGIMERETHVASSVWLCCAVLSCAVHSQYNVQSVCELHVGSLTLEIFLLSLSAVVVAGGSHD